MIGEELYAGAAYVSRDPVIYGTVVSQDILRFALYVIILAGGIVEIFSPKNNFVRTILKFLRSFSTGEILEGGVLSEKGSTVHNHARVCRHEVTS